MPARSRKRNLFKEVWLLSDCTFYCQKCPIIMLCLDVDKILNLIMHQNLFTQSPIYNKCCIFWVDLKYPWVKFIFICTHFIFSCMLVEKIPRIALQSFLTTKCKRCFSFASAYLLLEIWVYSHEGQLFSPCGISKKKKTKQYALFSVFLGQISPHFPTAFSFLYIKYA